MDIKLYGFFIVIAFISSALSVIPKEPCKLDPWSNGKIQNPGAKLRLNPSGLNLSNSLAFENVTEILRSLQAPDVKILDFLIYDLRVSNFSTAKFYLRLAQPNVVKWGFDDGQLAISAGFKQTKTSGIKNEAQTIEANITIEVGSASLETSNTMLRDVEGRPSIISTCTAKLGLLDITIDGNITIPESTKRIILDQIQRVFQPLICTSTNFVMKITVNDVLRTFQSKVKLDGNNLILDYSLMDTPKVSKNDDAIEGSLKGSVYYRNPAAVTFYPPTIEHESANESMLDFYLTDYVMNTLLYSTYKEKLLNFEAIPKTVSTKVAEYLGLSCLNESGCVGSIFTNYSGLDSATVYVKAYLQATESPKVIFENNEAYWIGQGTVGMDLIDETNKTTIKLFSAKSKCSYGYLTPKIYKTTLYATMNFTALPFNEIDSPEKDLTTTDIEKLQTILSLVFEEILNGFLSVGFPVPLVKGVSLVDPTLQVLPRFCYVSSNFTYSLSDN